VRESALELKARYCPNSSSAHASFEEPSTEIGVDMSAIEAAFSDCLSIYDAVSSSGGNM